MAIYDTSNVLDNSIFLKAKLEKNMVSDNYYIENLQHKRNRDWEYRYNVIGIEEELNKQISYTSLSPSYTPIDVVIDSVKADTGEQLSGDWARLSFKDLNYPCGYGRRYRFSMDFPDMSKMTEEQKHYDTSVWLTVNFYPLKNGSSCVVRRCNTSLSFIGSPTNSNDYITEIHEEPCILENEMKNIQFFNNETLTVPQAEWYATMQLNYFTNQIKINDRFLFGTMDSENRDNNSAFKVKAVIKAASNTTFVKDTSDEIEKTPLIVIALDRDAISPDDDFTRRVAKGTTIYKTQDVPPVYQYYVQMEEPSEQRIILGETQEYTVNLYYNKVKKDNITFNFTSKLKGIVEKNWPNYYHMEVLGPNKFSIKNLKACNRGPVIVTASCVDPDKPSETVSQSYEIELGGFY